MQKFVCLNVKQEKFPVHYPALRITYILNFFPLNYDSNDFQMSMALGLRNTCLGGTAKHSANEKASNMNGSSLRSASGYLLHKI